MIWEISEVVLDLPPVNVSMAAVGLLVGSLDGPLAGSNSGGRPIAAWTTGRNLAGTRAICGPLARARSILEKITGCSAGARGWSSRRSG